MIAVFISLMIAVGAGCAPRAESGPVETTSIRLSVDQPRQGVRVPAAVAAAPPDSVTLAVTSINNPTRRAFLIRSELRVAGRPPIPLGVIAPFPADQPGRFILAWSNVARRAGPDARLWLTLEPIRREEAGVIEADVSATWSAGPK